jgi:hypothetical protein
LVYGENTFRPVSDVDILVPPARFPDAVAALQSAGFTRARWEPGRWEVSLSDPTGPPLNIDLHRRLSRTSRSRLAAAGLFQRGRPDARLFGAPVVLPSNDDLFAHLLLHAALHWINEGQLHRPQDFQAVADSLSLDPRRSAEHLREQGLGTHALVLLPLIRAHQGSRFCDDVLTVLAAAPFRSVRDRMAARVVDILCATSTRGRAARRLAGLALAPSLAAALVSAARDRLAHAP